MNKYAINTIFASLLIMVFFTPAYAQEGAKALFYGDTATENVQVKSTESGAAAFSGTEIKTETVQLPAYKQANKSKGTRYAKKKDHIGKIATGLSYWIEVVKKDGKVIERTTAESRVFKTGERIRFAFKSNKDGYLYLLAIGASGKGAVLFPDKRINDGKNYVVADTEYKVPFGEKSFVMDATPGKERVLVFFSQSEVSDITNYFNPKSRIEAQDTRNLYAFAESKGSKDIVFEEDAEGAEGAGIQPASYIVNRSDDPTGIIFKEIEVRHKKK